MPDGGSTGISADRVRYIKLGEGGSWEKECFKRGIVRMGYNTGIHFDMLTDANLSAYGKTYTDADKGKGKVTEIVNVVRIFRDDPGVILWITFSDRLLRWCFLDPASALERHSDGRGTFRRTLDGWHSRDLADQPLRMETLSGHITQLAAYRGTCCDAKDPEYVVRRINGERRTEVVEAERLTADLRRVIISMMKLLTPQDFELLVDLVFSGSGWRRQGGVGKTEKLVDMELWLPTTDEHAFVQVKSKAKQREFDEEYAEAFTEMTQFGRMFYVYHSGHITCSDDKITILDPEKFAAMVLDAGLTSWLMQRVG